MVAVAVLTSAIASSGLCGAGWFVNFLDLAPHYASVLFGVSNTFSTVPGIVGPYLTGVLTRQVSGRPGVARAALTRPASEHDGELARGLLHHRLPVRLQRRLLLLHGQWRGRGLVTCSGN